jgi:hypothetical protein
VVERRAITTERSRRPRSITRPSGRRSACGRQSSEIPGAESRRPRTATTIRAPTDGLIAPAAADRFAPFRSGDRRLQSRSLMSAWRGASVTTADRRPVAIAIPPLGQRVTEPEPENGQTPGAKTLGVVSVASKYHRHPANQGRERTLPVKTAHESRKSEPSPGRGPGPVAVRHRPPPSAAEATQAHLGPAGERWRPAESESRSHFCVSGTGATLAGREPDPPVGAANNRRRRGLVVRGLCSNKVLVPENGTPENTEHVVAWLHGG